MDVYRCIDKIHRTSIAQGDTRRGGNLLRSTQSECNELNEINKISRAQRVGDKIFDLYEKDPVIIISKSVRVWRSAFDSGIYRSTFRRDTPFRFDSLW